MQAEHHDAISRDLRITTQFHGDIHADHYPKPDTRRFATIFPGDDPEIVSIGSSDTTQEENDSDDLPRFELVAALDKDTSTTQVTSQASANGSSTLSAALVACRDHVLKYSPTETGEKELPRIPDDQRSMYTLATSTDTLSAMDTSWKPKTKVRMRRADQRALMQAQSQAIAMMRDAGLKPKNKIQCRCQGCADILPDVQALKYHLHIHNIADSAGRRHGVSPSAACRPPSLVGCSIFTSETLKRNNSRSKSSLGTQYKCSTTFPLPRELSTGSLFPSLFSPREVSPEVPPAPSLTTVAKAFTPDPSPNKQAGSTRMCNETPSRGRRKRKESIAVSVSTERSPTIAMLLSPPTSPIMQGSPVHTPHVKLPRPLPLGLAQDAVNDNSVSVPNESAHSVFEQLTGSRSPMRALSPTRAMSPIRNGIKRILSIGSPDNVSDR